MTARRFLLTAIAGLASLPLPLAAAPAGDRAALVGAWVGGFRIADPPASISLRFRAAPGVPAGLEAMLRPVAPAADTMVVQAIAISGDRVRFEAGKGADRLRFDGRRAGARIRGTVTRAGRSGPFALAQVLPPLPAQRLAAFVGDYEIAPGQVLVIGRSLGQLFYLEPARGRQGPMYAISDSSFVAGPTVGTTYPLATELRFERTGGEVSGVRWREDGRPESDAHRIHPYDEEEVTFRSGDVTLAGSVLIPRGGGLHPGVVLVHGSNAQSRNGQRSIYRFHADHFARRGIAVLIYDKRGIGGSGGSSDDPGLESDALAAVRLLRAHAGVDSARVGLWGLSQGAWLIGQAAALAPADVAFIVPVGGGALNPHVQEIRRTELQMRADGFLESDIREATALQMLKFRYARRRDNWDVYHAALERARGKAWLPDPYVGPPDSTGSPAWDFWQRGVGSGAVEPADYLRRVRCPVLAVDGDLDLYGGSPETLTLLDTYLQRGGNRDVTLDLVPSASHAIYEAKTGAPSEEPFLERFAPGYLDRVSDWILSRPALKP